MVTWDWWNNLEENLKDTQTQPRKFVSVGTRIRKFGWKNTAKFYFTEFKNIFEPIASRLINDIKNPVPFINPIQSKIAEQLNNINAPKDEKQKKIIKVEEPEEDSDAATKNYVDKVGIFTSAADAVSNGFITVTDSNGTSRRLMTRA